MLAFDHHQKVQSNAKRELIPKDLCQEHINRLRKKYRATQVLFFHYTTVHPFVQELLRTSTKSCRILLSDTTSKGFIITAINDSFASTAAICVHFVLWLHLCIRT
jgi:hypothetical protein